MSKWNTSEFARGTGWVVMSVIVGRDGRGVKDAGEWNDLTAHGWPAAR